MDLALFCDLITRFRDLFSIQIFPGVSPLCLATPETACVTCAHTHPLESVKTVPQGAVGFHDLAPTGVTKLALCHCSIGFGSSSFTVTGSEVRTG